VEERLDTARKREQMTVMIFTPETLRLRINLTVEEGGYTLTFTEILDDGKL
jgi:hypothetical protein